jgi:preprotein translocase subunit SecA
MVSLEDELIRVYLGPAMRLRSQVRSHRWRRALFSVAQRRAEMANAGIRRQLLSVEDQLGDMLAFTGRRE